MNNVNNKISLNTMLLAIRKFNFEKIYLSFNNHYRTQLQTLHIDSVNCNFVYAYVVSIKLLISYNILDKNTGGLI